MDYQLPLFRPEANYQMFPCSRSVGKTESLKARAVCHAFHRQGEDMLVTAPELIHLLPLTDAIEERIQDTRLTREFLNMTGQKTGFTHRPFGCVFQDGTKIVGRIPRQSGVGVKGAHAPDMMMDESQNYSQKGFTRRLWLPTRSRRPRGPRRHLQLKVKTGSAASATMPAMV